MSIMRFVDRTQTIQEIIWQQKGENGDLESIVLWLESRLNDDNPYLDIRVNFPYWFVNAFQGCHQAAEMTEFLDGLEKQLEKEK